MWISKKKIINLEKRIADLEKSQLQATNMVKQTLERQIYVKARKMQCGEALCGL